jgi:predicted alpha/beta hydrolase
MSINREKVRFASGDADCAAWHYRGTNGACVIMTGGFAVTKEPGTDEFARRFNDAGFSVLAFEYRRIGESSGTPRQVLPIRDQLADWDAAIAFAPRLPGVDRTRLAIWGFSASGGHIFRIAARHPELAAAIAQTPNSDGLVGARSASRHQTSVAMLRFVGRGLLDAFGGLFGRAPRLVPLVGERGTVALLTTPDALDGGRALNPGNRYPDWQQAVAARSALPLAFYRPGRDAARVQSPLLVLVCDNDQTAPSAPSIAAAHRAPHGELASLPGGHYEPFLSGHERAVEVELSFLRRYTIEQTAQRQSPVPA